MPSSKPVYLIPEPVRAEFPGGTLGLREGWSLVCETQAAASLNEAYATTLGISLGASGKRLRLVEADLGPEAYRIELTAEGGAVAAGSEQGFRLALQSLRQMLRAGDLPVCVVEDHPRLGIRGFHTNFQQQTDFASAQRLIESAGRLKLNALLLEYEARFPYRKHQQVRAPNAFSEEEVRDLVAHARSNGLETIPLQQSLGHLDYVLRHDEYAGVREEDQVRDQMCPLNPRSFELFTALAEEVLSLHPDARFLHVGGDETRQLGVCPRCRERAREGGLGSLYGAHMERVLGWVLDRGLRPILWDDMLCAHPEALAYIPRETVIMYWEYWTVDEPSPYFVARFNRKGKPVIVHDARWGKEWPLETLPDVQRGVLNTFSTGVDLETDLGEEFLGRYGKYLGPDFPRFIRPFPYLEYYQDQGFEVLAGPSALGNHEFLFGLPNVERFFRNIHAYAGRCRQNGRTLGLVTTSWYNFPPELLYHGLVATSQFAWADR
jgi:hypothetical protein